MTILAGAGGVGKTFLAEQIARHIASGVRLGRFPLPEDGPAHTWCLFLEDVAALTQQRSLDIAELGSLPEDLEAIDSGADTLWYCEDAMLGIAALRARLHQVKEDATGPGIPELIIIDYLHLFIGGQPAGASPVEWERQKLTALRELAIEYGLHILVLTHMNKSGAVNGTAALLNACDSMFVVEAKDDRNYAALLCRKMRIAPMTDYALSRRANGTWGFDDQVFVSEAMADGMMRDILAVLRVEGPKTLSQLCMHPAIPGRRDGIRQALTRGRRRKWVTTHAGHWRIVPTDGDTALQAPDAPTAPDPCPIPDRGTDGMLLLFPPAPCVRCGGSTPFQAGGIAVHMGGFCSTGTAAVVPADTVPVPAPRKPEPEPAATHPDDEPDRSPFQGLDLLKATVKRSRYHPILRIEKEHRGEAPWTWIQNRTGGEPDGKFWSITDIPMGGRLVLLDRNGSYPSACSSVPLAPNKLLHTGPLTGYDRTRAGVYRIELPQWTDPKMPHPLGKIADTDEPVVTIATPHLKLLAALAAGKRMAPPVIVDSYTGIANESLFEGFYKAAREERKLLVDTHVPGDVNDPYTLYKRSLSKALRLLWPTEANSPFWRPDWRVAMVAEAAVRHWLKASAAVRAGDMLISLRNTDEALFWMPDDSIPHGYKIGKAFGQVEIKELKA